MSMFLQILLKIDKAIRNFVWFGSIDKRKFIIVSLSKCCLPKKKGGLVIKIIWVFNKASIGKLA